MYLVRSTSYILGKTSRLRTGLTSPAGQRVKPVEVWLKTGQSRSRTADRGLGSLPRSAGLAGRVKPAVRSELAKRAKKGALGKKGKTSAAKAPPVTSRL